MKGVRDPRDVSTPSFGRRKLYRILGTEFCRQKFYGILWTVIIILQTDILRNFTDGNLRIYTDGNLQIFFQRFQLFLHHRIQISTSRIRCCGHFSVKIWTGGGTCILFFHFFLQFSIRLFKNGHKKCPIFKILFFHRNDKKYCLRTKVVILYQLRGRKEDYGCKKTCAQQ